MLNEGLVASSVGSYRPLFSQSGPKCASIAAGSNDLAKLSRPGVATEVTGSVVAAGAARGGVVERVGAAESVIWAIKNGI